MIRERVVVVLVIFCVCGKSETVSERRRERKEKRGDAPRHK